MNSLVVCATFPELASFFARHSLKEETFWQSGARLFSLNEKNHKMDVLISGPGVFNCACALTSYLVRRKTSRIFCLGIAGVFEESGLGLGDVAVADQVQYLHAGVEHSGQLPLPLPFELIQDAPDTCFGRYPCDSGLSGTCFKILQERLATLATERFQVAQGKILTVSLITGSPLASSVIAKEFSPVMEAMEGAAAAHVAVLHDIPMVEIRAGSNMVGERNKSRWNIDLASRRIAWILDCLMKMKD